MTILQWIDQAKGAARADDIIQNRAPAFKNKRDWQSRCIWAISPQGSSHKKKHDHTLPSKVCWFVWFAVFCCNRWLSLTTNSFYNLFYRHVIDMECSSHQYTTSIHPRRHTSTTHVTVGTLYDRWHKSLEYTAHESVIDFQNPSLPTTRLSCVQLVIPRAQSTTEEVQHARQTRVHGSSVHLYGLQCR